MRVLRRCYEERIYTVHGDPFHDVNVFGQHEDRLEVTLASLQPVRRGCTRQGLLDSHDER